MACAWLVNLAHGSSLVSATEDAYGDGYTGLVRVGSAGGCPRCVVSLYVLVACKFSSRSQAA